MNEDHFMTKNVLKFFAQVIDDHGAGVLVRVQLDLVCYSELIVH